MNVNVLKLLAGLVYSAIFAVNCGLIFVSHNAEERAFHVAVVGFLFFSILFVIVCFLEEIFENQGPRSSN